MKPTEMFHKPKPVMEMFIYHVELKYIDSGKHEYVVIAESKEKCLESVKNKNFKPVVEKIKLLGKAVDKFQAQQIILATDF